MIDLSNIRIILRIVGISRLKIDFDDEQELVNVDYVFKGKPGTKQITHQEIIDALTIGTPGPPVAPELNGCWELRDLPGET